MVPESEALADEVPAPTWKCILAAAPAFLLAAQFLLSYQNIRLFGLSPYDMTGIMLAEWYAVGSVIYLAPIWLWQPVDPGKRRIRNLFFVMIYLMIFGIAFQSEPAEGVQFVVATAFTYFGLVMGWKHRTALLQLGARWGVAIGSLTIGMIVSGAPQADPAWHGDPRVLVAGMVHFSILAAVEARGFYLQYIPRNAGPLMVALNTLPGKVKEWLKESGLK